MLLCGVKSREEVHDSLGNEILKIYYSLPNFDFQYEIILSF